MNIDTDGLQAFVQIAESGSFRDAANELFITQSALSHRLSKFEEQLGVRLFDRTTRRIRLTAIGKDFLPHARRLIEDFKGCLTRLREMATQGVGDVTLACISTAATHMLPEVVSEYAACHPNNRVRILDVHSSEAWQLVLKSEAEFGITAIRGNESNIEFEPLFDDPFVVACRQDHVLAKYKKVKWIDLNNFRLIAVGRRGGTRGLLDVVPSNAVMPRLWSYEVQNSLSTGLAMVKAGIGVIAVPRLALPLGEHPLLVTRPLIAPSISRTIGVIRCRGATLSPAAQEFLDLIKKYLASQ